MRWLNLERVLTQHMEGVNPLFVDNMTNMFKHKINVM